jgi:hypothetical protein
MKKAMYLTTKSNNDYLLEINKLFSLYQSYFLLGFYINSNDFKVNSLEWTLTSPPEAHTFHISPKVIAYGDFYPLYRRNYQPYEFYNEYNILPVSSGVGKHYINNNLNAIYVHVFVNTKKPTNYVRNLPSYKINN